MKLHTLALAFALSVPVVATAAEVYRWVDDHGQVVYGTVVPERHRSTAVPASTPLPPGVSACEARWHRYMASAACFDQYRVVGGGLKAEAYKRCTEVPQPEPCT
jgi:hypothetical protein